MRRKKTRGGVKRRNVSPASDPVPPFAGTKEQDAFYSSHDFSELFERSEVVESNPAAIHRLRGRRPDQASSRPAREMRLLVPLALADEVRTAASNAGRSVSNWLLSLVQRELVSGRGEKWELQPGETSPVLGNDGNRAAAFLHVNAINFGGFAPRVRAWVQFCDSGGRKLFDEEMPIRWSSRPEPLMLVPFPSATSTIEYRWVPNPAFLQDGYVTDFGHGEEQAFAFAIKMPDGTCWGWTQESYWHGWRHPAWRLPAGKIRAVVRLSGAGEECRAEFELDTEEDIGSIVVKTSRGGAGVQGQVTSAVLPAQDLPENVVRLFGMTKK